MTAYVDKLIVRCDRCTLYHYADDAEQARAAIEHHDDGHCPANARTEDPARYRQRSA